MSAEKRRQAAARLGLLRRLFRAQDEGDESTELQAAWLLKPTPHHPRHCPNGGGCRYCDLKAGR